MKITDYGRTIVKTEAFSKALAVSALRNWADRHDMNDCWAGMAIYTAASLCTDRRGCFSATDAELTAFVMEKAQEIVDAINDSNWMEFLEAVVGADWEELLEAGHAGEESVYCWA